MIRPDLLIPLSYVRIPASASCIIVNCKVGIHARSMSRHDQSHMLGTCPPLELGMQFRIRTAWAGALLLQLRVNHITSNYLLPHFHSVYFVESVQTCSNNCLLYCTPMRKLSVNMDRGRNSVQTPAECSMNPGPVQPAECVETQTHK